MKFLGIVLSYLFFVNTALAGLPPTTLAGQGQSNVTTFGFKVPNKQATQTSGPNSLIETGNRNLLANPSFEHSSVNTGWSSSSTGTATPTISSDTSTPIAGAKSLVYSCAGGASGGTCTLFQDATTAYARQGLVGLDLIANSAAGEVVVWSRVNGSNNQSVSIADTSVVFRKIPTILGTTSTGIAVVITVSAGQTVQAEIDEATVEASDLKQDVDQSRLAGESYFAGTASCVWSRTSTSIGAFTSTAACPGPTIQYSSMGSWQTTDSDLPRQTINNLPTGVYKAKFYVGTAGNGTNRGFLAINDGSTTCEPVISQTSSVSSEAIVECTFTYTTPGNRVFELYGASTSGAATISNDATAPRASTKFILEYFGSSSVYTSQNSDTDWASCGHTTSDFTGFGTVTNIETQCKREGADLLMRGKFTSGTSTAVEARLNLKLGGTSLTSQSTTTIPTIQVAGSGAFSGTGATAATILIEPSVGYVTFGAQNGSAAGLSKMTGSSFIASSQAFSFFARIPINGWTNSNVIIGTFNEMVNSVGMSKPKKCWAYFGGAGSMTSKSSCTGTCTVYAESGGACGSVTVTRAATGVYTCTWGNGTWANNSMATMGGALVNYTRVGDNLGGVTSTGSAGVQLLGETNTGTDTDGYGACWIEGQAP